MFYVKNLPNGERVVRVLAGLAGAVLAVVGGRRHGGLVAGSPARRASSRRACSASARPAPWSAAG